MSKMKANRKLQTVLLILTATLVAYARVTGPEPGYTGAPKDVGNCTACHDHPGQPGVGPGSVRVDGLPQFYQPGQTYPLTVTVQQAGRQRFGFQLTALDSSDERAGTLQSVSSDTQVIAETGFGGRQYIEHTQIGTTGQGSRTWQIRWVAPSTDVGTARFFVAGNAADGDGTNQGNDYIYLNSASSDSPSSYVTVSLQSRPDGLTLSPGSKYTISWNTTGASNIDNIEVRYSTNNGADNFPFTKQIAFITDPSVTSAEWTVPDVQTSQAVIRIQVGKKSGAAVDVRSGLFTISGSGSFAPKILDAMVSGKKLYVMGENFDEGASIYMCAGCVTPAT
ncbi:MAG TPA: Reeler domain-containing protein, partial [Blastocatellia bacterium]|nr:Reeler domain-containing protein [Blastocatellia bacterium]